MAFDLTQKAFDQLRKELDEKKGQYDKANEETGSQVVPKGKPVKRNRTKKA